MSVAHPPPAVALRPGDYDGQLMLAVAPDGTVRARFFSERGQGVRFSCELFFRGRAGPGGRVEATSWDGDPHSPSRRATLTPTPAGLAVAAPGASDFDGCGMAVGPMLETPDLPMELERAAPWTTLLRVRPARVRLRATPSDTAGGRAYVVRDDVLGVTGRAGGWLRVDYPGSPRWSSGWVRAEETAPLPDPPPAPVRR